MAGFERVLRLFYQDHETSPVPREDALEIAEQTTEAARSGMPGAGGVRTNVAIQWPQTAIEALSRACVGRLISAWDGRKMSADLPIGGARFGLGRCSHRDAANG
jgi:hypothetical protein